MVMLPQIFQTSKKIEYFHRLVIDCPDDMVVDHIKRISDGDICDNRKSNLRIVDFCENIWNSKNRSTNTSGCKGVNWNISVKKWETRIMVRGIYIRLGLFDDLSDAIEARKKGELEYYGRTID